MRFVGFTLILVTWLIPAAIGQKPDPDLLKAMDSAIAQIPEESRLCELAHGLYEFGGKGGPSRQITFRGEVLNRSLAPFPVAIHTGLKERPTLLKGEEQWFVRNTREATLEVSLTGLDFALSMTGPPQAKEAISKGLLAPVIEIRDLASGELLDATLASPRHAPRPVPEFDSQALGGPHTEKVAGYEIVWSATLAAPQAHAPALFRGEILNPLGKEETVLLRAGLINRLGGTPLSEGWAWHSEESIPIASSQARVPFELRVSCPGGVYVGISNRVYEGKVTLWTEKEVKKRDEDYETSRRSRNIEKSQFVFDPQISGIVVSDATFAYTRPGKRDNAGEFVFSLKNKAAEPRKIQVRYGFLSAQPSEPLDARTWHFTQSEVLDLPPQADRIVTGEVKCHVQMESLVDSGRYTPSILILPEETGKP
jgi:hypothetical protein